MPRDAPILMNYAVRITTYDNNGQVKARDQKLFALRVDAEDFSKKLREEHNKKKILSYIEVIKLETGVVVQNFKTKNFIRAERRNKSRR